MKTAVVVDDSPIELLMGKTLLEKLGYTVFSANNGEDALQLIREHFSSLVVCDITMPGMSGLEVLEATRSYAHPPIFIMASSLDDAEHAVECLRKGAYGYLTKPLREEQLRNAIDDAMARRDKELEAREHLETITKYDPLTGVLNKDEFVRLLALRVGSSRRQDHPGALLFVNVDGLRYINNSYGHQEGDRVLQHVAAVLTKSIRPNDFAARFGGDVFAIHLAGIAPSDIRANAQRILDGVEAARVRLGGKQLSLTVTLGVTDCPAHAQIEGLINDADFSLHLAKRAGRNRFHIYHEQDKVQQAELGEQLDSLEIVKSALEGRRFEMHYQPIVNLQSGETRHYEALIRLFGDDGKMLAPGPLIKTAELFGLINKVDRMVVSACLEKLEQLSQEGSEVGLAINLSGKSVEDPELLHLIQQELAARNIEPSRVTFEITETALFHNLDQVQSFVQHVKDMGCRLALDDFGVGFSSFYYIKQLDIDYLKIDGSFIQNLLSSLNDQVFVRAMVEISRVFGMQVIAEWVENGEVAELLKTIGVDYGQGYHFGKPSPKIGSYSNSK
jgi:diguanylate cyclase (GGDEF)-like protein